MHLGPGMSPLAPQTLDVHSSVAAPPSTGPQQRVAGHAAPLLRAVPEDMSGTFPEDMSGTLVAGRYKGKILRKQTTFVDPGQL